MVTAAKRQYSESDKATALALLAANAGNITRTARETGFPATTLRQWRDGEHINEEVTQKRDQKKEELADLFERVTRVYLDRALAPDTVSETKGKDAVIAAATATDKMQLLKGAPTAINQTYLTDEQKAKKLAEIINRGRERMRLVD
ncbi:MAG: transposase [Pyrinomonadaceae bacterium]